MNTPEADFQDLALAALRASGAKVQKFHDEVGIGIPDVFAGWSGGGMWLELKWKTFPVRPSTPLRPHFRGPQRKWLSDFDKRPLPTAALVGTPEGWIVVPAACIDRILLTGPSSEVRELLSHGKVTPEALLESYVRVSKHGRAGAGDSSAVKK